MHKRSRSLTIVGVAEGAAPNPCEAPGCQEAHDACWRSRFHSAPVDRAGIAAVRGDMSFQPARQLSFGVRRRSRTPLPPMLGKKALHVRDATPLGHPLFGVEAILIARLLRLVHRYRAMQRLDQRRQDLSIQR